MFYSDYSRFEGPIPAIYPGCLTRTLLFTLKVQIWLNMGSTGLSLGNCDDDLYVYGATSERAIIPIMEEQ